MPLAIEVYNLLVLGYQEQQYQLVLCVYVARRAPFDPTLAVKFHLITHVFYGKYCLSMLSTCVQTVCVCFQKDFSYMLAKSPSSVLSPLKALIISFFLLCVPSVCLSLSSPH